MLLWMRRSTGKAGFMRRMPKTECPMKTTTLNVKPRLANPAKPLAQMPKRIQLSRKRGWRKPANTVVGGRQIHSLPVSVAEYKYTSAGRGREVIDLMDFSSSPSVPNVRQTQIRQYVYSEV